MNFPTIPTKGLTVLSIPLSRFLAGAAIAAPLAIGASPAASDEAGLDKAFFAYVWGADLTVDVRDESLGVDFSDLINNLEAGFLGHLEVQGDSLGGFTDIVFIGVGNTVDRPNFTVDADNDTLLMDAALVWSPGQERLTGFEAFGGIRYISNDFELVADPVAPGPPDIVGGSDASYTDGLIGARYIFPVAEHWRVTLRGDVSGGDTEGTWSASAHFGYTTGRHTFLAGYRHLEIDLLSGSDEDLTVTMAGPMIAYGFSF